LTTLTDIDFTELLGANGPVAQSLQGFAPRPAQQHMAAAVADALANCQTLIVEAGTGTGKTFGYLVPALLAGQKIILSTGTKYLQDQLFDRDIPLVRQALTSTIKVARLKGRANYLCLHRLDNTLGEAASRLKTEDHARAAGLKTWSNSTKTGDIAEAPGVPEDWPHWSKVTSTAENCLGQNCPVFNDCFVTQARRTAQDADLVVVNHHLLLADVALKEGGFGELLPTADAVIIDEAHQLPDIATQFFGTIVTSRQITGLVQDILAEQHKLADDSPELTKICEAVQKKVADFRLIFGINATREPWQQLAARPKATVRLAALQTSVSALKDALAPLAKRAPGLESAQGRCADLYDRLNFITAGESDNAVRWAETTSRAFALRSTPLDVAPHFQNSMFKRPAAWVFTSATLAVGNDFSHFVNRIGAVDPQTMQLDSPFNFQQNALMYLPRNLPPPSNYTYTAAVVDAAIPIINTSQGRAFFLFTSYRALREAAELLADKIDFPLLIQGSAPRGELIRQFREHGNAVLLGTSAFWEGVDVRGEALSLVIIDKLPFAAPNDPLLAARLQAIRNHGGEPFMQQQIPHAVITLKQGAGRLIRDVTDRGVLMLCDPRLTNKGYGRLFINSLPKMPRTGDITAVEAFYSQHGSQSS